MFGDPSTRRQSARFSKKRELQSQPLTFQSTFHLPYPIPDQLRHLYDPRRLRQLVCKLIIRAATFSAGDSMDDSIRILVLGDSTSSIGLQGP